MPRVLSADQELKKTMKQLEKWGEKKQRQVKMEVAKSAYKIEAGMVRRAPVFEGMLRADIKVIFVNRGFTAKIGTDQSYAPVIEFGRRPGSFPPFGPGSPLSRWVALKLGIKGKQGKQVAFLVARKIFKHGFPAQPFMRPAFRAELPRFRRNLIKIMKAA